MTSNIKLSICIPTYSRSFYLKESLDQLLPQAEALGVEICVSDNNSMDDTAALLESKSLEYSCLKYISHPKNTGLEKNMLFSMNMASGDYILPIGDDEVIPDGTLSSILNALSSADNPNDEIDLLILDCVYTDDELNHVVRYLPERIRGRSFENPLDSFDVNCLRYILPPGSFVVRSSCLARQESYAKYLGTSHSYAGAVWEYLAWKYRTAGKCRVDVMNTPTVLLRGGKKTWQGQRAIIMLHEIPKWFSLLPHEYMKKANDFLKEYHFSQSSYFSLLRYRATGQLTHDTVISMMTSFSVHQVDRANLVCSIPVPIARVLTRLRAAILNVAKSLLALVKTKKMLFANTDLA